MVHEEPDDGIDVDDHAVDREGASHRLDEEFRLREERKVGDPGPFEQPLGPGLAVVLRKMDTRRRVLRRQLHEVVATFDVVVEAGHAHTQLVGDRLHRDTIEADLVGRLGDHLAVELRRTPGFPPRADAASTACLLQYRSYELSANAEAPPWVTKRTSCPSVGMAAKAGLDQCSTTCLPRAASSYFSTLFDALSGRLSTSSM